MKYLLIFNLLLSLPLMAGLLPDASRQRPLPEIPANAYRPEDIVSSYTVDELEQFIKRDDCPNLRSYKDQYGNSLLHYAATFNKDRNVLKLLTKLGIKINVLNNNNQTPLHLALQNNADPSIVEALLKLNANPNLKDKQGNTAFAYAIPKADLWLFKLLKSHKAYSDVTNSTGSNVLIQSIENEQITDDLFLILVQASRQINKRDRNGYTALINAIRSNLPQRVETLIRAGANVNVTDINAVTPLMHAAISCDKAIIFELLISNGANVFQRDSQRKRAIDYARRNNNETATKILAAQMDDEIFDEYDLPFRRRVVFVPSKKKPDSKPNKPNKKPEPSLKPSDKPHEKPSKPNSESKPERPNNKRDIKPNDKSDKPIKSTENLKNQKNKE